LQSPFLIKKRLEIASPKSKTIVEFSHFQIFKLNKMYQHFLKRLIDFILALVALTILSPILIPVVVGLLLTGEHYVFYFQKRIGYKKNLLIFGSLQPC